jgi:hypothetical protein
MTGITEIKDAFDVLFESLILRNYHDWTEQELLPLTYTYLVGAFGLAKVDAEVSVLRPTAKTGVGRVDFVVDGVAVELAVRANYQNAANLNANTNRTEVEKLMKYSGKALLVLFDFSTHPMSHEALEAFRVLPTLGRGNHNRFPFNIGYFHCDGTRDYKRIRV